MPRFLQENWIRRDKLTEHVRGLFRQTKLVQNVGESLNFDMSFDGWIMTKLTQLDICSENVFELEKVFLNGFKILRLDGCRVEGSSVAAVNAEILSWGLQKDKTESAIKGRIVKPP